MKTLVVSALALIAVSLVGCSESSADAPAADNGSELNQKGPATLRIALIAESTKGKTRHVLASSLNEKFKAAGYKLDVPGYDAFPDYVDIKDAKAGETYLALVRALDDATTAAKLEFEAYAAAGPESFQFKLNKKPVLCYTGNPRKVVDALGLAISTVFSEQLGVWAWRYKTEKNFVEADEATWVDDLGDYPDIWTEWRGQGEAVLLMTHEGDGGDDVETSIVSKCPN